MELVPHQLSEVAKVEARNVASAPRTHCASAQAAVAIFSIDRSVV